MIVLRRNLLACLLAMLTVGGSVMAASGATSTTVVSATVPSATNLAASGCASGVVGRTDFGMVLPGSSSVTTIDCSVTFGSSNDVARLRVAQSDGRGAAMWQPTRGTQDTAFDGDGAALMSFAPGLADDTVAAVAVQADGRVLLAGECSMGATGFDTCLGRLTNAGVPDPSFSDDGAVTVPVSTGALSDGAAAIVVQPDGRIVVAGYCRTGTSTDMCLLRLTSAGVLDTTFDGDGIVVASMSFDDAATSTDYAAAVQLQADGRIVFGGPCAGGGVSGQDFCVGRVTTAGALDTTFAGDGSLRFSITASPGIDRPTGLAIGEDGAITVAGTCAPPAAMRDACAARLTTAGALDTTFSGDGVATAHLGDATRNDEIEDVAVDPDGRVVLAGSCRPVAANPLDACVARFTAAGVLDATFSGDGLVTVDVGGLADVDRAYAVALVGSERIVVSGECYMGAATSYDACMLRLRRDGSLDLSLDTDGRAVAPIMAFVGDESIRAGALDADGAAVLAGSCDPSDGNGYQACVTRLVGGGALPQYADGSADWDTAGAALFGACLRGVTSATAAWTTSATCPASDGLFWNPVAATQTLLATADANTASATASLRFGLRTTSSQSPGAYLAPITFDVVAP